MFYQFTNVYICDGPKHVMRPKHVHVSMYTCTSEVSEGFYEIQCGKKT